MDTLIYLLTVGLLATAIITFKVIDALAKEVASLKRKLEE
jgi:AmiR/NasT family two-component response regulator